MSEQEIYDKQDKEINQLSARLEKLVSLSLAADPGPYRVTLKHMRHIEKGITVIFDGISPDTDVHTLQQFKVKLSELKKDFLDVQRSVFSMELEDTNDLGVVTSRVEEAIFGCAIKIQKCLHSLLTPSASDFQGVKLPKLDVPTFDGSLLNWKTFWEQFNIAVHIRTNLTDSEKSAYLCHALQAGSAKPVIEGLSRYGEHYAEAIACLQARYDRPCLIHQAHVKKILEIPTLRDCSGKEL